MKRQLPGDPDPLEVEPEPVRRDLEAGPPYGFFALIGAALVILGLIALASLVAVGPVR